MASPLPSSGDDEALIADVPFSVPDDFSNIGGATLLLGVRDNDIKEHGPNDLQEIPIAASDPKLQAEHCLRAAEHDEPDGSRLAVEACREFIAGKLLAAIDGLDEAGAPDGHKRDNLRVTLAIRDQIDVSVPRFFLQAGRALHAIQDSFTHTFRNPDEPGKIRVVLNFLEYTQDTLDPAVDGPPHASELDECSNLDELRSERLELAKEASSMALLATLDPKLDIAGKERAIEGVLDDYLAYDEQADCSAENGWCDAAETQYGSPTLGCHTSRAPGSGAGLGWLMAAGAWAFWRGRRARWLAPVAALLLLLGVASPARADSSTGPIDSPAKALAGESSAAMPGKVDKAGAWFGRVSGAAAYDNTALVAGLGLRYQFTRKWMVGLDGEWNPYVSLTPTNVRMGSANAYVSLIRRFQQKWADVNIRSQLALGASMLLFDLVGADQYSMGPYIGLSFLGVEWKAARGLYVTFDPTYIAIPIPNVVGVPFMYAQYRFTVGLEFGG
ncbi:MAG TPA: hypothetical protein VIW29_09265 [Polyangiaceae bacterium]